MQLKASCVRLAPIRFFQAAAYLTALVAGLSAWAIRAQEKSLSWTDQSGKFKVQAEFVGMYDDRVTLRKADGVEISVSLGKLDSASKKQAQELAPQGRLTFKPYRPQTAIAGIPLEGPAPQLARAAPHAEFSLSRGPTGLEIDPQTGAPSWRNPVQGRHVIRIEVTEGRHSDIVESILHVVPKFAPDVFVHSTEHVDFVLTKRFFKDNAFLSRVKFLEAEWETYAEITAQEPINDRQIYLWNPATAGALAGNPITFGGNGDPEPRDANLDWERMGYVHELAHNFNYLIRTPGTWSSVNESEGFNTTWLDWYTHHLTAVNTAYVWLCIKEEPSRFGLSKAQAAAFKNWCEVGIYGRAMERRNALEFKKSIDGGKTMETAANDHKGIFSHLCFVIAEKHGRNALRDTLRLMRHDVLPNNAFNDANTTLRKFTALVCLFSAGAKKDVRPLFAEYGLIVDKQYYDQVEPTIAAAVKNLPEPGEWHNGWIKNPANGNYYRVLRWKTDWEQANRTARQWGGRLLQIETSAEQNFAQERFLHLCPVWLGLHDDEKTGEWRWTSGAKLDYSNWNTIDHPAEGKGYIARFGKAPPEGSWRKENKYRGSECVVIVERAE